MLGMVTFSFYDELEISECPDNLYDLKQKIKTLYLLDENQIKDCILSYKDKKGDNNYIFNEEQFEQMIPIVESIIIKIELIDDLKYLTIDSMVDEEYPFYKIDKNINYDQIIQYNEDEYNIYPDDTMEDEIDKTEDKKEDNKEDKIEDKKEDKKEDKRDIIKQIHCGIKCNICQCKEIIGIRYLCGVCQNFNLCEECEKNYGKNHNHPLLKIRNPDLSPISFTCKIDN